MPRDEHSILRENDVAPANLCPACDPYSPGCAVGLGIVPLYGIGPRAGGVGQQQQEPAAEPQNAACHTDSIDGRDSPGGRVGLFGRQPQKNAAAR